MMRRETYCLALLVLAVIYHPVSSISFSVVPDVRKCLREEVHKDVLVVGDYKLSDVAGQKTDIMVCFVLWVLFEVCWVILNEVHHSQVADSKGHTLFHKEDASKGKFAFTTEDYDMFEVCFVSVATGKRFGSKKISLSPPPLHFQVVVVTMLFEKSIFP